MSETTPDPILLEYRYEALFGAWLAITGATFLRISRQPYSSKLKIAQTEHGEAVSGQLRCAWIAKRAGKWVIYLVSGALRASTGKTLFKWAVKKAPDKDKESAMSTIGVAQEAAGLAFPATFTCPQVSQLSPRQYAAVFNMLLRVGSLSVEFSMWNPLYAIAPIVLLLVSIPLAGFAIVTTSIAITLLSFRALVVYFQLGLALIRAWLSPPSPKSPLRRRTVSTSSSKRSSPSRRRRSSNTSTASQDTVVPASQTSHLPKKSGSLSALIGTSEITRDFEGVGGWRMPGDSDEEALWMGLNKRLQLPADVPTRRHKRSLTGGTVPSQRWTWSPEALRMSPVQSRARTPVRFAIGDEGGYFAQPLSSIRPMSSSSDPLKYHKRRKSGSGSSTSSIASASGISMAIPEAGE